MLEIEKIKELIEMMVSNDLVEISLRDGAIEVNLRRPNRHENNSSGMHGAVGHHMGSLPMLAAYGQHPGLAPPPPAPAPPSKQTEKETEPELNFIRSPMVGMFYTAPDPDSRPFVLPGDRVGPDTVVCIIEAMKVFNEIKAEISGVVVNALLGSRTAVEFGQPLFSIRPL